MKRYWIVGNRAFETREAANEYCEANDFDSEAMITEAAETCKDNRYYEIISESLDGTIRHRTPTSAKKLRDPTRARDLENLRNGEYMARFVRMSEITRDQYDDLMREYGWVD